MVDSHALQADLDEQLALLGSFLDEEFQVHMEYVFSLDSSSSDKKPFLHDPLAKNFQQAKASRDWATYYQAMKEEIEKLEAKKIYGPWVDRTPEMNVIGGTWAEFKLRAEGMRGRYVLRGDQENEDQKGETSAPTPRSLTRYAIMVKVCYCRGARLLASDISGAYLEGKSQQGVKVYTGQIRGFYRPELRGKVRQVIGNQYGKCDAGFIWRQEYHRVYTEMGFRTNRADICLYSIERGDQWLDVMVTVDDGFTAFLGKGLFDWYVTQINKHFKLNMGDVLDKYVGYEHVHYKDQQVICITAVSFIENLLSRANMTDCKPSLSPYTSGVKVEDLFATDEEEKKLHYAFANENCGQLRYIAPVHCSCQTRDSRPPTVRQFGCSQPWNCSSACVEESHPLSQRYDQDAPSHLQPQGVHRKRPRDVARRIPRQPPKQAVMWSDGPSSGRKCNRSYAGCTQAKDPVFLSR
jgi:hypothetical protein